MAYQYIIKYIKDEKELVESGKEETIKEILDKYDGVQMVGIDIFKVV